MVDFLKHRFLAFTPGTCDSVGLRWCLGICICNKLLGTAGAAGLGTILENHCFNIRWLRSWLRFSLHWLCLVSIRFLVFVFGNVVSSSRCHVYSLVYIVFSDIDVTGVLILCKGLFFNPFGLPFLDSMMWMNFSEIQLMAKGRTDFIVQRTLFQGFFIFAHLKMPPMDQIILQHFLLP